MAKKKKRQQARPATAEKPNRWWQIWRKEGSREKERRKREKESRFRKDVPQTAQQTIPYLNMYPDGICQVTKNFFTKTIQFYDINYQLALTEDKNTIFENYCDFLNYFDSSVSVQLSFMNQQVDITEYEKSINIPDHDDDFNEIREEYRAMLKNQLAKGCVKMLQKIIVANQ